MFNSIRANIARLISPTGNFPVVGTPQIQLVSPPALGVAGPGSLVSGNPSDLSETIKAMGVLRRAAPSVRAQAVAARPAAVHAGRPAAITAPAPAPAPADPVQQVIDQLVTCLEMLKGLLPVDEQADDAGDEAAAFAALRIGDKPAALRHFDARISSLGAKISQKNARTSLRSEPSSRSRAGRLIRGAFSEQVGVAKIEACLHGPHPGPAAISTPAMPMSINVPAAASSPSGSRDRARAIKAELNALDKEQRREFSNERDARYATLNRELLGLHAKFSRPQ